MGKVFEDYLSDIQKDISNFLFILYIIIGIIIFITIVKRAFFCVFTNIFLIYCSFILSIILFIANLILAIFLVYNMVYFVFSCICFWNGKILLLKIVL